MERIIHCNQLLIQAERMIADFAKVARPGVPAAQRQQFAETYLEWYTAGQSVILDDLRTYYESRYTTSIGGLPSVHDLLIRLTSASEEELSHFWVKGFGFKWTVEEQCEVLRMTRREIFPRQAQIPYETRLAIATICKRVYHEPSIDSLFIDNGCLLTWWMPPFKPIPSKRMSCTMGWLDGIVLYAPDRELPIVRAVCEEILRKSGLRPEIKEELQDILQQLTPSDAPPTLPTSVDDAIQHHMATLEDIAFLQELLETYRTTARLLLQQTAQFTTAYIPPVIQHGIQETRREIARVKAELRAQGVAIKDKFEDTTAAIPSTSSNNEG